MASETNTITTDKLDAPKAKTFNFNQPMELMDPVTYGLYFALRYQAQTAGPEANMDWWPDGKTMTEAQVAEIIGPAKAKAAGLVVPPGMKEPAVKKTVADNES